MHANPSPPGFLATFLALLALVALVASTPSCSNDGFGRVRNPPRLVVDLDPASTVGTLEAPLDLAVDRAFTFKIVVRAVDENGVLDTSFNRFVRISTKPGAIEPLVGPDTDGRNLLIRSGESVPAEVKLTNAYGLTYIVADDIGYVPADPLRDPPPACANGVDDDGDGVIDFPADDGCAFANDDDEKGGSFSQGASTPIFFRNPRIADVRGLTCSPALGCTGNGRTPYPREQVLLDVGGRGDGSFAFSTVVTRLSNDGFYVADLGDQRGGFSSIFSFNFNAPPRMRVCDRMKTFGGTANEFFGFTQIAYPTWTLEEWDPARRLCLVPPAVQLTPDTIRDVPQLLKLSGGLVRVDTFAGANLKVTPKFGPGDVPTNAGGLYVPNADATNCDLNKDGRITFATGHPENACAQACSSDPECTEWSNFAQRGGFRVTVSDATGQSAAIQADASASAGFDPVAMKGKPLRSLSGTLHFFSGGSQFTIEVRCKDDIALPGQLPFPSDLPCATDADCSVAKGLPPGYSCSPLNDGARGCRKLDPARPDVKEPPPLGCVFPRTFLDNNPQ